MVTQNQELFKNFSEVHARYNPDTKSGQTEFNDLGRDVQDVIRDWEDRLCSHSENTKFGKFSTQLSDKFWAEIRKAFPKIDHIGLL